MDRPGRNASIALAALACLAAARPAPAPAYSPEGLVGVYDGGADGRVELVAGPEGLFAVIDEAKYQLRPLAPDLLVTATGEKIPIRRDAEGRITGYVEGGAFHRKLSDRVSPEAQALMRPRPLGASRRYGYRQPEDLRDGIAVGDAAQSDLGVDGAQRIVQAVLDGEFKDVDSVLIYQHGRLVLEEYFYGYDRDRPHQLRSATKSIVSALAGAAIATGALPGVDAPVLPLMPYRSYAHPDPRKAKITLADLLTMRSGLACDDRSADSPGAELKIYPTADWVKTVLDLPMTAAPGREGHYCSGGVDVVGRAVERATGERLPDFAQARLFGPLGIPRDAWRWNYDLTSADREYAQIHLRPRDMLKLGILFAQGGRWHGRQVLPQSWVAASLAPQSRVDDTDYGYFWWRPWLRTQTPQGVYQIHFNAAQGNGGQKIYIVPQYGLVAVFTGGAYNTASAPNRIMATEILPRLIAAEGARPDA